MGYISDEGLTNLKYYKYVSGGQTPLDVLMNPWWELVVGLMPMVNIWVAPNLITFVGFLFLIIGNMFYLCYDINFNNAIPQWVFFYNGCAIFLYQTLDAIDGKQARRTASSSVLGQLVDHGLDSYSLVFLNIGICQAFLVHPQYVNTLIIINLIGIYIANWSESHLGKMLTKVGYFGVTESQFVLVIVQFVTAFYGQIFWQQSLLNLFPLCLAEIIPTILLPALNTPLSICMLSFIMPMQFVFAIYVSLKTFYHASNKSMALIQFFPCLVILANFIYWTFHPYFQDKRVILIMFFGTVMSTQCCKLILSTTTKTCYRIFNPSLLTLTTFSIVLHLLTNDKQRLYLSIAFYLYISAQTLRFLFITQKQITQHLGIYLFSLEKRKKQ